MPPQLSVVFMIDSQRRRAAWALQPLLAQEVDAPFEVLLFDFAYGTAPALAPPPCAQTFRDFELIVVDSSPTTTASRWRRSSASASGAAASSRRWSSAARCAADAGRARG